MAKLQKDGSLELDMVMLVHDNHWLQYGANPFIHSLSRIFSGDIPIFMEPEPGAAQLGHLFNISLLDRDLNKLVLRYFPKEQEGRWPEFELAVRDYMEKNAP